MTTASKATHTPGELLMDDPDTGIVCTFDNDDDDGDNLFVVKGTNVKADTAELVRRWNAFPALVAACEKMIAAVKDMHGRGGIVAIVPGMHLFEPFEAARAALAAAEVQS